MPRARIRQKIARNRHHHHPARRQGQCGPKLTADRGCSVRRRAASCGPVRAHAASSVACLRRACPRHVIHFAVRVTRCLCAHTCLRVPYLPHTSTPTHHSVSHRAFVSRPSLAREGFHARRLQVHPGQGQQAQRCKAMACWHGSGTATPTCILGRQHILRRRAQLDEAADAWSRRFSCVYVASCSVVYRVCAYICHFMTALMCCVTGRLVEETPVLGAHILLL